MVCNVFLPAFQLLHMEKIQTKIPAGKMKYEKKHNLFHISAQYAEGSEAPLNHKLLGPTSTNDSVLPFKFLYFVSLPPPSVCFCCLYVCQKSIKPIRRRDILSYFIDYLTSLLPVFYLVDSQDIHKKIPSTVLYSFYVVVFSEELLYYKFCHHGRSKSKRGSEPPILSK